MKSPTNALQIQDWKQWIEQTLIFSFIIPGTGIFIYSIGRGIDVHTAAMITGIALFQAVINLYGKYKSGKTPIPVIQEIVDAGDEIESKVVLHGVTPREEVK